MNKKILLFFLVTFMISACVKYKAYEKELLPVEGYKIEVVKSEFDTSKVGNWYPEPALKITYKNTARSNQQLNPAFEFYPASSKEFIRNKTIKYMVLRSNIYPPEPECLENDKYFVLAWDTYEYGEYSCKECNHIKEEIMRKYNLKPVNSWKIKDLKKDSK